MCTLSASRLVSGIKYIFFEHPSESTFIESDSGQKPSGHLDNDHLDTLKRQDSLFTTECHDLRFRGATPHFTDFTLECESLQSGWTLQKAIFIKKKKCTDNRKLWGKICKTKFGQVLVPIKEIQWCVSWYPPKGKKWHLAVVVTLPYMDAFLLICWLLPRRNTEAKPINS